MKHFIDPGNFESDALIGLLDLADRLRFERNNSISHPHLRGRTLGVVCRKPAPGLQSALAAGMLELGGTAVDIPVGGVEDSRLAETVRFASCGCSALALYMVPRAETEKIAADSDIPVVNCANDADFPVFVLSALMTLREKTGALFGRKICFIDSDCRAYDGPIYTAISCGMRVSVAAPIGFRPNESLVDWALRERKLEIYSDPVKAAKEADAICTGIRAPSAYPLSPGKFSITDKSVEAANAEVMLFHAFPELHGDEIADGIYKEHRNDMLAEAKNRLHIIKALLTKTVKDNK